MPNTARKDQAINADIIAGQIDNCVMSFFEKFNIDIYDPKQCATVTHNQLTLCMMDIYNNLFKPSKSMINNQKSLLDYNNIEQLEIVANSFIKWCMWFNKSLGLVPFSYMTGISTETLRRWSGDERELNPARYGIIKSIQEGHKQAQINLLNGSPVGALAVANNDRETGLNWAANQAQQIGAAAVYILPSERADRLQLGKAAADQVPEVPEV